MILRGGPPLYVLSVDDFKRWAPQLMLVGLTRFTLDTYEAETSADSIIGSILDNSKNNPYVLTVLYYMYRKQNINI